MQTKTRAMWVASIWLAMTATTLSAEGSTIYAGAPDYCRETGGAYVLLPSNSSTIWADQSNDATVDCPLNWTGSPTLFNGAETTYLYYHDPNSTESLSCTPYYANTDGTTVMGTTVYSCSTAGGCSTSTPSYTGTNYLQMSAVTTVGSSAYAYTISCTLPYGVSRVASAIYGYYLVLP